MTLPARGLQAEDDARRFAEASSKEDARDHVLSDARFAPGEEPTRFRRAKAKAEPTTPTEQSLIEMLRHPMELGFYSNALLYARPLRYLSTREKEALYKLFKGGAVEMVRTSQPDTYWLVSTQHNPNGTRLKRHLTENSGHYVWVTDRSHQPLATEVVLGPYDLETAKTMARISATKGSHDRIVSRGRDPEASSFDIVRGYRSGTGKRFI